MSDVTYNLFTQSTLQPINSPLDQDTAVHLITHLWRGGRWGYLWRGQGKRSRWTPTGTALPDLTGRTDYYFGLHPTAEKPKNSTHKRSQRRTVCAVNTLFGEFDAKDFAGGLPAALDRIHSLPLPPSVIVFSGGGFHCYWLLRETFYIETDQLRDQIDRLQKRWVDRIGSDPGAKDLARMLRVPGTRNYKEKYAPDYPPVTTVHADFDCLYDLTDFEAHLPADEKPIAPERQPFVPPTTTRGQDQARQWAADYATKKLAELAAASAGERNRKLYSTAFVLGQLIQAGLLDESEVLRGLLAAGRGIGLDERETAATAASGLTAGLAVAPDWLPDFDKKSRPRRTRKNEPPPTLAETILPVNLPATVAHHHAELPYISDLDPALLDHAPVVLVKSSLGTGKTELVRRAIARAGEGLSILVITHRQALAADIAQRLDLECYLSIPDEWLPQAHRLVITPNSLHKIGTSHPWDMVIIDELEQFLVHLQGDTFRGGESHRAHQVLAAILSRAHRIIGLDAHLTDISAHWVHTRTCRAPTVIVNDFKPDRGTLTLYADGYQAIGVALHKIEADRGPVIIPCASEKRASEIHKLVTDRFGETGVVYIHGENSTSREMQAFIRNINHEIPQLRALICTSSLGTGLDVTAPVYAVVGIMHNQPLVATDHLQLIMRYRNAQERHVFVQPYHGPEPRDPETIVWDYLEASHQTAQTAEFARYGVTDDTSVQLDILRLEARLHTAVAVQLTDLVSTFAAYAQAEGFRLVFNDQRDPAIRQAVAQARQDLHDAQKARTLAASPVSAETYRLHQIKGTMTPEISAGLERWKIENTPGLPITSALYDDLHTPAARASVRRLADILANDPEGLKARDRQDAAANVIHTKRGHYTTTTALVRDGLSCAFGKDYLTTTETFTAEQIRERLAPWLAEHGAAVDRLVGSRKGLSRDPLFVVRRLLKEIGFRLEKQQVMRDGERFMLYWLDADRRAIWIGYASARVAHLAALQAATTNREELLSTTDRSNGKPGSALSPPFDPSLLDETLAWHWELTGSARRDSG